MGDYESFNGLSPNDKVAPWYGLYSLEEQREKMVDDFSGHLSRLGMSCAFQGLLHTPPYEGYRNNNKFTFGYGLGALDLPTDDEGVGGYRKLGFIGAGYPTNYILPCDEAVTINDDFKGICHMIEGVMGRHAMKPFIGPAKTRGCKRGGVGGEAYVRHQGVWHYLKVRHSLGQDGYMVLLVNFTRHIDGEQRGIYEKILEELKVVLARHEKVLIFGVQEHHATLEPQPYDPIRILLDRSPHQEGALCESLLGHQFLISPTSFFQVNTKATEQLYRGMRGLFADMIQRCQNGRKNRLLDMYCGTGSIGICLADLFDEIIGMDEVDSCIRNAERNRRLNGVMNARYVVGKCEQNVALLESIMGNQDDNLYIMVNPARDGLHRKVRKFLRQTLHKGLVYSSCNVDTWVRDVGDLCRPAERGCGLSPLHLEKVTIFDLFPHTPHYEVLSCLMRD